jgi:hypothetical protein
MGQPQSSKTSPNITAALLEVPQILHYPYYRSARVIGMGEKQMTMPFV